MTSQKQSFSAAEARRIALYAQGFGFDSGARALGNASDPLEETVARLGLLQIDSINVFARSHYLPIFSRAKEFTPQRFDERMFSLPQADSTSNYIEYRTHELAFMPAEDYSLWGWRMNRYRARQGGTDSWAKENPKVMQRVLSELRDRGPLTAAELVTDPQTQRDIPYWSTMHSAEKHALELLFHSGEVVSAGRHNFRRRYGLAEQVLSPEILAQSTPDESSAITELVRRSVRHLGIASVPDIADYFRLRQRSLIAQSLAQLQEQGEITSVEVPEWGAQVGPVWLDARMGEHPEFARIVQGAEPTQSTDALLSPFDPLVWFRPRAERIFNFNYRIEIYVPEAKRQFGYYSLPVLLDERIVGRFDLKAERKSKTLEVRAAWVEDGVQPNDAARIAQVLDDARHWQGLEQISISDRGNFHKELRSALKA
ncbi:MAG: crosslink repair DNA glycosylase YcaQ family protein [Microbacteriaceae bacterium]